MSFNTFGHLFRFTSFGESHGPAIGCVVDGCPPRIPLKQEDIQRELDRRRPGQSRFTTQRQEPDAVKIMSGVFQDERMPKQVNAIFSNPGEAPYLSVVTPSTHDMSTIRGGWEEDENKTQFFYNNLLGHYGKAPQHCTADINKEIILQHLGDEPKRRLKAQSAHRRAVPAYSMDARAEAITRLLSPTSAGAGP